VRPKESDGVVGKLGKLFAGSSVFRGHYTQLVVDVRYPPRLAVRLVQLGGKRGEKRSNGGGKGGKKIDQGDNNNGRRMKRSAYFHGGGGAPPQGFPIPPKPLLMSEEKEKRAERGGINYTGESRCRIAPHPRQKHEGRSKTNQDAQTICKKKSPIRKKSSLPAAKAA